MKISIIGTGYVGLVSGLCFSEIGHDVICVDKDRKKILSIKNKIPPIHETGLKKLLDRNFGSKFQVTEDIENAVLKTNITFLAVGTPLKNKNINLTYIKSAAKEIGYILKRKKTYHIIVVKSTVVPGTTDELGKILEKYSGKKIASDFDIAMNPEFLREGNAVNDFMNPDRIVIGANTTKTQKKIKQLYSHFKNTDFVLTNNTSAELIKYTSNAFFATLISFSNEISKIAKLNKSTDVTEIMSGLHLDKRLSPITKKGQRIYPEFISYLEAGCGFGGSCFPKDLQAIIEYSRKKNTNLSLFKSVIDINNHQPNQIILILKSFFKNLNRKKVSILGLSFKPDTDDVRESPSIKVINELIKNKVKITVYDPIATNEVKKIYGSKLRYAKSLKSSVLQSEAVVIMTSWKKFYELPKIINNNRPNTLVVDGRRMLKPKSVKFYEGIGYSK